MDDLLALMDEGPPADEQVVNTNTTQKQKEYNNIAPARYSESSSNRSQTKKSVAPDTIDPLTKIRIISRQISRVDLVDHFSLFQFHTTPILASMSKHDLANLITQPSTSSSSAAGGGPGAANGISGKTNMATMGIVFNNSGTKISTSNGRAFSIITIGELHTGPAVTVMLFGQAYQKFVKRVQPGSVVAILASSIMPARNNNTNARANDTRITLTIRDDNQILIVGKALDYGTCAAVVTKKNYGFGGHNNNNSNNGNEKSRCKNYVDLRVGRFCKCHANQQQQPSTQNGSNSSTRNRKGMSVIKSMRAEHHSPVNRTGLGPVSSRPTTPGVKNVMTMSMPQHGRNQVVTHVPTSSNNIGGGLAASAAMRNALSNTNDLFPNMGGASTTTTTHTMTLNNGHNTSTGIRSNGQVLRRAPKHMQISSYSSSSNDNNATKTTTNVTTSSQNGLGKKKIQNPYSKKNVVTTTRTPVNSTKTTTNMMSRKVSTKNSDVLGQALGTSKGNKMMPLQRKQKRGEPSEGPKRKRARIDHMEGYDGAVHVPKPNKLFNRIACPSQRTQQVSVTPSPPDENEVLQRQRELASRLREQRQNKNGSSNVKAPAMKKKKDNESSIDDLLGGGSTFMSKEARDKILSSKSRYSAEADAEVYVRARNKVNELERKETTEDKREAQKRKSRGHEKESAIQVQWHCETCKKHTNTKPSVCIQSGHVVRRKRDIKWKKASVEENRMNLNKKSAADGGMVLGSGLEWSGWKGI